MEPLRTRTNRAIRLKDIPEAGIDGLREWMINECASGRRVSGFFGDRAGSSVRLYAVLADDETSELMIARCAMPEGGKYRSMTPEMPQVHMYERELYEQYGIRPEGHPWMKPVRGYGKYEFLKAGGEENHEVAVGPVHAGVIEPGHFRFICAGEKAQHLEIKLGYQHRGIEEMLAKSGDRHMTQLAESITGDTSVGHAVAYASALEALAGVDVPRRAQVIRGIALELERAAMHAGCLGAMANDVAYLLGAAVLGANRTTLINTSLALCGSRFGRGLIRPGGVNFDVDAATAALIAKNTGKACAACGEMAEEMFSAASVMSRFQQTGVLSREDALKAGITGLAARASGIAVDSRADHPYGAYMYHPIAKSALETGDVYARALIRHLEMGQSESLIIEMCGSLSQDGTAEKCGAMMPDSMAVSMVEGHRGGIVHSAITDGKGDIRRYKINDPSFNNWFGLALAMRGNGISDFPLCNKSFDLSYCGNDL